MVVIVVIHPSQSIDTFLFFFFFFFFFFLENAVFLAKYAI